MPLRVLLVLDDPDRTGALQAALTAISAEVLHAASVDEALTRLEDGTIGAAIVDLHLPRTSAFVLAQRLRTWSKGQRVIVVALTRIDTPEVHRVALQAGFDACFPITVPAGRIVTAILEGGQR